MTDQNTIASGIFGDCYSEWRLVERFTKRAGGDGQDVELDDCRMPSRFFRIRALPGTNSVGEPVKSFTLATGSGCEELARRIAQAVADGMLGIE